MKPQTRPIREVIGENISLSSFAKCMGVSRPTLYKYMAAYDSKDLGLIPDNVLKVFDAASSDIPKDRLRSYFNELYESHVRTEERRLRESPVPPDIAEIVDGERLDAKDGLTSGRDIVEDSKGRIWIGTNDNGLAMMERGELRVWGEEDGLTSSKVGLRVRPSMNVGGSQVPFPNYIKLEKKTGKS